MGWGGGEDWSLDGRRGLGGVAVEIRGDEEVVRVQPRHLLRQSVAFDGHVGLVNGRASAGSTLPSPLLCEI